MPGTAHKTRKVARTTRFMTAGRLQLIVARNITTLAPSAIGFLAGQVCEIVAARIGRSPGTRAATRHLGYNNPGEFGSNREIQEERCWIWALPAAGRSSARRARGWAGPVRWRWLMPAPR